MPLGNATLGLDALLAVFVLPIAVVVALAAFTESNISEARGGPRTSAASWFFFNLLAASMLLGRGGPQRPLVPRRLGRDVAGLVLPGHERGRRRRVLRQAGWIYLVAMHLGTACLLVLFLLLGRQSGSLDFDRLAAEPGLAGMVFLLAVVGIRHQGRLHAAARLAARGASGGAVARLGGDERRDDQDRHLRPAADADLPRRSRRPGGAGRWSRVGVISGILGVLFALAQHDLKRLLAYHSVENIGIIALGLGVGMLGVSYRHPAHGALGFLGAMLHVLNHALFKSLLFLGAGPCSTPRACATWTASAGC